MLSDSENSGCPCGSGQNVGDCCLQLIRYGLKAQTAEALMRSRYSAYVLGEEAYLLASWHADTRPAALNLSASGVVWTGLEVIRVRKGQADDKEGSVEFIARYRLNGSKEQIHELSRFVFEQGQWFYLDGDLRHQKIARNAACPCGSGKKYKRCCA